MKKLTKEELRHCDTVFSNWETSKAYAGGFQRSLMLAMERADWINLKKLGTVYPNLVECLKNHTGG